jgi:hypothetical protein
MRTILYLVSHLSTEKKCSISPIEGTISRLSRRALTIWQKGRDDSKFTLKLFSLLVDLTEPPSRAHKKQRARKALTLPLGSGPEARASENRLESFSTVTYASSASLERVDSAPPNAKRRPSRLRLVPCRESRNGSRVTVWKSQSPLKFFLAMMGQV